MNRSIWLVVGLLLWPASLKAGEVEVVKAELFPLGDGIYRASVTLRHTDEGWDHYADRWEILDPEGNVIAVRELAHPHENEQPFTRSLGGISIPAEVTEVIVRGRDSRHGYGGSEMSLEVPR